MGREVLASGVGGGGVDVTGTCWRRSLMSTGVRRRRCWRCWMRRRWTGKAGWAACCPSR